MSYRVCSCCGREKSLKGGKICTAKGHFICYDCVYKGSNPIFTYEKSKCPVCKSSLR